ncbi:MAG: hypothetical protein IJV28_02055 [Paludibacteraceae bacterium]|nr:hypothetical protein [Paludibacteraceae bacterium]
MINLSVDAINLRAPYKVEQAEENIFLFTTKHGIMYSVGFARDYTFMEEGLYQFFITNISGRTLRVDKDVYETVRVIVEEFFSQDQPVMLYICDTTDKRQASRDRLFRIWFHTYMLNTAYTMYNEQVTLDNVNYFASIILRKDHPMHNQVISSFHDFILDLPGKYEAL